MANGTNTMHNTKHMVMVATEAKLHKQLQNKTKIKGAFQGLEPKMRTAQNAKMRAT